MARANKWWQATDFGATAADQRTGLNNTAKAERVRIADQGHTDLILRYWDHVDRSQAETLKDALNGVSSINTPKVDGQATDGDNWINSFVYIQDADDGSATIRQWLTRPLLQTPTADTAQASQGAGTDITVMEQAAVGRYEATKAQEYRDISDTDANTIMASTDSTYTPDGLAFYKHTRERHDDGTNTVRVTGMTPSIHLGAGLPDNASFTLYNVIKQTRPASGAANGLGYEFREYVLVRACLYTSSESSAKNHLDNSGSGSGTGSFMKRLQNGNFYAERWSYTQIGSWLGTAWPDTDPSTTTT